jgi:peptidoglycan/LPS O-acetylase OafA/YrhL
MVPAHGDARGTPARSMPLQALRGLAAVSVAIYHAAHFTAQRTGAAWLEQVFSGRLGLYGVLAFFVLSGYLMEAAVRRYDAGSFLLHRFLRLYPTYWLIFLGYFLLQGGGWGSSIRFPGRH